MPFFEFLNAGTVVPQLYGIFHIISLLIIAAVTVTLCLLWKKGIIKNVNQTLVATAIVVAVFELYHQINTIFGDGTVISYNLNALPLHYNSIILYIGIIAGLTKNQFHRNLCSYLGTFSLIIGAIGLFYPETLFSEVIGLNVYAMVTYGAMVVMGIFLWVSGRVKPELKTFVYALPTFLALWGISITLNVLAHTLFPEWEKPNYFGSCPVCAVGEGAKFGEYFLYCLVFGLAFSLIAFAIVLIAFGIRKLLETDFDAEYGGSDELANDIRREVGLDNEDDFDGIFKLQTKKNPQKESYLYTYFNNLKTNFGHNVAGSCGYVAVAMLLSYYDTILHDKIVPRRFDKVSRADDNPGFEESPGTRYFEHPEFNPEDENNPLSYKRYIELVNRTKNTYLHEALLSLGTEIGIADAPKDKNSTEFEFNTDNDEREKLIKKYLKKIAGVSKSEYNIQSLDYVDEIANAKSPEQVIKYSERVRKYAIKKIKKGFPVLLSIAGEDNHAVIAYDYDKKTDSIYCHFGWDGASTHATPESEGYSVYRSAMILEFDEGKIAHSHTNNYEVVINGAIFYYCPDGTYTTCDDLIVEFDKNKNQCAIVDVYGNYYKNDMYIPETIGNVTVSKIYSNAFENQKHINEVRLPFTLTTIERNTFKNNVALKTVIIPKSVKRIKKNAFKNCTALDSIIYLGTKQQWTLIKKSSHWNEKTGDYTIRCTDGFLVKHNTDSDNETLL